MGALQIFQNNVVIQSQVLSIIDIYFGLAVLSVAILCLIGVAGLKNEVTAPHLHFHLW